MKTSVRSAARAAIFLIELYRNTVSPLRLPTCRFTPTCSQYAVEALGEYGLIRGGWLATVRLLKCGPWHRGGWDPIPERAGKSHEVRGDVDRYGGYREFELAADDLWDAPAKQRESESRV